MFRDVETMGRRPVSRFRPPLRPASPAGHESLMKRMPPHSFDHDLVAGEAQGHQTAHTPTFLSVFCRFNSLVSLLLRGQATLALGLLCKRRDTNILACVY